MYRECDNCKSVFKIPKILSSRLSNGKESIIYCPFCECTSNHEVKQEKFLTSIRGYIK